MPARNDFVCMIGCVSGRDAVLALGGNQTLAKSLNASYFQPPYQINNGDNRYNISYKTVAVTAQHYDGTLEYNAHNLYGMYETLATANALQKLRNKRQFILTRCFYTNPLVSFVRSWDLGPALHLSCSSCNRAATCICRHCSATICWRLY